MSNKINILELFSGIGGFSKGLQEAGFEFDKHYFSEIDKHAIANYKYNFPNAEYIGSVTNVRHIIRTVDRTGRLIITFGSPCQDFSLVGKREGLEGTKSSLIKYAVFLIRWLKPDVFIWENVKGAYSSNAGADYWAIMQAFANLDGYRCEGQLLNTAWFLPQNRERIYVVGHLAGRSKGEVFPIGEAGELCDKAGSQEPNKIASTINASDNKSWVGNFIIGDYRSDEGFRGRKDGNSPTLQARARTDGSGQAQLKTIEGIRRLTEIECERLQGFPDNWTMLGNYDGEVKEISATQRYKMCGNAVTVAVVKEIGKIIKLI